MNCCENLRARPARQQCAHYIAVRRSAARTQEGRNGPATRYRAAVRRPSLKRQRPGLGEPPADPRGHFSQKWDPNSPKAGLCATRPAHRPTLGESLASQHDRFSQAGTMRQGCGATSRLGRVERVRAANAGDSAATSRHGRNGVAQDLALGEAARRSSRLPAETSDPLPVRKGGSLPRRDDVQIRAIFDARKTEILPSKDDAPLALRNVPAWESLAGSRGKCWRSWRNVPAREDLTALRRRLG